MEITIVNTIIIIIVNNYLPVKNFELNSLKCLFSSFENLTGAKHCSS